MVFNCVNNFYEILEVDTNATSAEIKTAYRKLARKYHPDVNKSPDAVTIFKEITKAYETLSNAEERRKYDIVNGIFSKTEEKAQNSSPHTEEKTSETKNNTNKQTAKTQKTAQNNNKTEFKKTSSKKSMSFIKKVKYFFAKYKKNKRAEQNSKPQRGKDITTELTVTPEEIMYGTKRILNIRTTKTCPKCGGHRFTNGDKCPYCNGKGNVTETKKITLTIPKGIKDGTKLCLRGEGSCGKNGGENGNIYVVVRIETKSKVHFNKLDIHYNVPITPYEAALGDEIAIPAFDGTIKLKLPKNTCSGQKFRIARQGLKRHGKIGDLIVTVNIEFSHNLSDDEIRLYEQLKNLSSDNVRKNLKYGS